MKKYNVVVTRNANLSFDKFENTELTVKSEAAMWNELRKVRDTLTEADVKNGVRAVVTEDETKAMFKDITFKMNSKGKIEMPNAVKETCRAAKAKILRPKKAEAGPVANPEAEVKEVVAEMEAAPEAK